MALYESSKRAILHTETIDVGSISANAEVEVAVTLPAGMDVPATGAVAVVSAPSLETGGVATAYVSAANEVTLRVSNVTEIALDPASQDYTFAIILP